MQSINSGNQYKDDIFNKLDFGFEKGKSILDLGCGDGGDSKIFINNFSLETTGVDIFEHEKVSQIPGLKFALAGIYKLPFGDQTFDYVWLHDVLHHIDEEKQSKEKHESGLREAARVVKKGGHLIIVEGNRYNPLFYPHMVLALGHNHFTQRYFERLVSKMLPGTKLKNFEAHYYPQSWLSTWKVYEKIMEHFSPRQFLAYNVAIWQK